MDALAAVLGLSQAHGAMNGDRLHALAKHEALRRARGEKPITGAMIRAAMTATTNGGC